MRRVHATGRRLRILRQQLQRGQVQNNKEASADSIEAIQLLVHACHVVRDDVGLWLLVGEEGLVGQIVGADPDGVDGGRGCVHESWFPRRVTHIRIVRQEAWDLVVFDAVAVVWRERLVAYGTGDGVVVDVDACVLLDVLRPDAAAGRGDGFL